MQHDNFMVLFYEKCIYNYLFNIKKNNEIGLCIHFIKFIYLFIVTISDLLVNKHSLIYYELLLILNYYMTMLLNCNI